LAIFVSNYWHPSVTADIVLLTLIRKKLSVLLVKRLDSENGWALPGGFIEKGETLEDCARRELKEETGVEVPFLSHFSNYSEPTRDTRHQVISVGYLAVHPFGKLRLKANSDVLDVNWFGVNNLPQLAFDHNKICGDGIKYSQKLILEKPELAFAFHKSSFTLTELQETFAAFGDKKFLPKNKRNFRLWLNSLGDGNGLISDTGEFKKGNHRPARLFMARY
jgi:8-oxo-dGTP diphosphatase